jgi:hypothetical protein
VQSPERLRVLHRPSAVDRVSAEAEMLTCKVLASSAAKGSPDAKKKKVSHMMFLAGLLLLRLTSCLIMVRLTTSCPKRSRSGRVSR